MNKRMIYGSTEYKIDKLLDNFHGVAECPHQGKCINKAEAKAKLEQYVLSEKVKLLEDLWTEMYRKVKFELDAHAPGVIVDTNLIKTEVYKARLLKLRALQAKEANDE